MGLSKGVLGLGRRGEASERLDGGSAVQADLTDQASLEPAFNGISRVFLYANHEGADGVIDAARAAGVAKIVLLSSGNVLHPSSAGNTITEEHRAVEDAFAGSGLKVVPIRPLVLATNALGWAWPIKADSSVALYQPDALTASIHERDIAAVAVAALTGNSSAAVTEVLTGPVRISQRDQVRAIATATGKDIVVTELSRDEASTRFARFMPAAEGEAVLQFLDDDAAAGRELPSHRHREQGPRSAGHDVRRLGH